MREICNRKRVGAAAPRARRDPAPGRAHPEYRRYVAGMRSGLLRSFSGLLGAFAFAVGVAGPVQWCACPTHGAALPPHAGQAAHLHAGATMPMPAADGAAPSVASHAGHDGTGTPHAAHRCTCPGGCCATSLVALIGHALHAVPAFPLAIRAHVAAPADAIELAESPQLSLPLANAPPAFRITLRSAAQLTT
jgi:hypothetical protein